MAAASLTGEGNSASLEEVAREARVTAGYLAYLEEQPAAQVGLEVILKLAPALKITTEALLGGGLNRPSGGGGAGRNPNLEALSRDECDQLLSPGGIGRISFGSEGGPTVLPVNFRMDRGDIVLRAGAKESLATEATVGPVSFEVDHLDDTRRIGWSVLVKGDCHLVTDTTELERFRQLRVEPVAGGDRNVLLKVMPRSITGRRITVQAYGPPQFGLKEGAVAAAENGP